MTEVNRRIRELTESRAALERRIGELSEENDRLRAAHAEVFAAHKDERARRQELEAACVCGKTPKDRGFLEVLVSRLAAVPRVLDVLVEDYTEERGRVAITIDGDPEPSQLAVSIHEVLPANVGTEGRIVHEVLRADRFHAVRWSRLANLRFHRPPDNRHVRTW